MVVLALRVVEVSFDVAFVNSGRFRNGFATSRGSRSVSTNHPPSMCGCNDSAETVRWMRPGSVVLRVDRSDRAYDVSVGERRGTRDMV